jgi:hypothetical protein
LCIVFITLFDSSVYSLPHPVHVVLSSPRLIALRTRSGRYRADVSEVVFTLYIAAVKPATVAAAEVAYQEGPGRRPADVEQALEPLLQLLLHVGECVPALEGVAPRTNRPPLLRQYRADPATRGRDALGCTLLRAFWSRFPTRWDGGLAHDGDVLSWALTTNHSAIQVEPAGQEKTRWQATFRVRAVYDCLHRGFLLEFRL